MLFLVNFFVSGLVNIRFFVEDVWLGLEIFGFGWLMGVWVVFVLGGVSLDGFLVLEIWFFDFEGV